MKIVSFYIDQTCVPSARLVFTAHFLSTNFKDPRFLSTQLLFSLSLFFFFSFPRFNSPVCGHSGEMAVLVDSNRCRWSGNDRRRRGTDRNSDELRHGGPPPHPRLNHLVRGWTAEETEPLVLVAERSTEPDLQLERLPGRGQH